MTAAEAFTAAPRDNSSRTVFAADVSGEKFRVHRSLHCFDLHTPAKGVATRCIQPQPRSVCDGWNGQGSAASTSDAWTASDSAAAVVGASAMIRTIGSVLLPRM